MTSFSIFGTVQNEIEDFKYRKIHIAGVQSGEEARYLTRQTKGYQFSQYETLNLIDLYYNSKFETGNIDSEGQRKLFLNICAFRADVASKMIDLDTKDFVFIPDDEGSKWGAYLIQKEFKDWARQNYFGEFINELVENYPKYGTLVVKKIGNKLERVPLRKLVVQQDALDLQVATHVIETHEKMTLNDMKKYPNWDTSNLDLEFGEETTVYERYGSVPRSYLNKYQGKQSNSEDDNEAVDVLSICTLKQDEKGKNDGGTILFMEEIKERPYLEVHWKKQDGRWLGIGEVENLFENQISRNMIANLRRRALLWSSKKIFQSPDDTVARNLVRDVKDGDIIRIMPNGNITQVDMTSKEVGEFQSTEDVWEKNSDQKSFTFEVATGEALPSGTPFRLGVVMSNAVNSHFSLKREKLGLFLKKLVVEYVFDIFKKENSKEHTATLFGDENGLQDIKNIASEIEYNNQVWKAFLSDSPLPDSDELKQHIQSLYQQKSHIFVKIPDKFYNDIKHHIELVITGEEVDVAAKIATFTTLYQALVQQGDPRAEQVLAKIMSLSGENMEAAIGNKQPPQQPIGMPQNAPQGSPQRLPPPMMPNPQMLNQTQPV